MKRIASTLLSHHKFLTPFIFGLTVFLLYSHNLDSFWHGDDPAILLHMVSHPLAEIFVNPAAWQALHQVNLTPWISLSFFIDYSLAGMNAEFFYWHHLVALALTAVASYLLLSLFVSRIWALLGSLLFLFGTPVAAVAMQLMTRHYIEGLWLSLFALYFFFLYQRKHFRGLLLASVACFALAITAKEIYVPLGILFVVLARGGWRERMWQGMPFIVVLLVYVVWRNFMLPTLVDGYVANTEYFTVAFWIGAFASFLDIPRLLLGVYTVPVLVLFGLLFAGTIRKMPGYWLLFLFCAGLICAPLIPLVSYPGIVVPDRFVLLPWYLFCFVAAFFTGKLLENSATQLRIKLAVVLVLWGSVFIVVPRARTDYLESITGHFQIVDTQMRFFWNANQPVAFIPTAEVAGALYILPALKALKRLEDPQAVVPQPILDDKFLAEGISLFTYSPVCECMADITSDLPARMQQFAAHNQPERPLTLEITNDDGLVSWSFGPYHEGTYNVIIAEMGSIALPRTQRALRTRIRNAVNLYLRYESPDGWTTYSSLIQLAPDGMPVRWKRD